MKQLILLKNYSWLRYKSLAKLTSQVNNQTMFSTLLLIITRCRQTLTKAFDPLEIKWKGDVTGGKNQIDQLIK